MIEMWLQIYWELKGSVPISSKLFRNFPSQFLFGSEIDRLMKDYVDVYECLKYYMYVGRCSSNDCLLVNTVAS